MCESCDTKIRISLDKKMDKVPKTCHIEVVRFLGGGKSAGASAVWAAQCHRRE